ncbi:MAG TPA: L-histidine N(alpha)-methyltransferase, partial [Marinilabiliaceae bacterium]|nr:L-histidine N(alpha)-methyltransferase [Marinilabiliaceae bacterium]
MPLKNRQVEIRNYLKDLNKENVRENILKGLTKTPKQISSRFFYDKKGSELFEKITKLKAYYPSEIEKKMLSTVLNKLDLDFHDLSIIELGSGDASKISLLFQQLAPEVLKNITYYPVDVSHTAIEKSAKRVLSRFPLKSVVGIVADFTQQMHEISIDGRKLICFFGSTIGNFSKEKTNQLMQKIGSKMNEGDCLLMGADIIKEKAVMEA